MNMNHVLLIIFGLFFIVFGVLAQTTNTVTIKTGDSIIWVVPDETSKVRLIYRRKDGSVVRDTGTIDVKPGEKFELQTSK
jgi:hypothetical protein